MTLNNYQWSNSGSQHQSARGKLELYAISMLSTKLDAISKRLERLNVNFISSSTPFPSCAICGSIDHLIVNCQVGRPFARDVSEPVNDVNNFNLKLTNDPFSDIYNHGWKNHPNFSYASNVPSMSQMNFRPPLGF